MATNLPPCLSRWAEAQDRNVFLWSTKDNTISMSWRIDQYNQVSIETMYRWFDTAWRETSYTRNCDDVRPLVVYPIDVERAAEPLSYTIRKTNLALPRDSQDLLPPGHYGVYEQDGTQASSELQFWKEWTFGLYKTKTKAEVPELAAFMELSASLYNDTLTRDKRCMLTGVKDSEVNALEVTWILPPELRYLLENGSRNRNRLNEAIWQSPQFSSICQVAMTDKNCLTMTKEITTLFRANKIGVDVDDNYRIVCFDKRDALTKSLKTHLVRNNHGSKGPGDEFLRAHFVRCLMVNTCDGDLRDEFGRNETKAFLRTVRYIKYDEDEIFDEEHEEWDTEIGRACRAWLQAQNAAGE